MLSTVSRLVAVALTAFIVSRAWDLSMLLEGGRLGARKEIIVGRRAA